MTGYQVYIRNSANAEQPNWPAFFALVATFYLHEEGR